MKLFFLILILVPGCVFALEVTPTFRVTQSMDFSDDLDFENMGLAIERQLSSFNETGLKGEIKFGTQKLPRTLLRESLILLRDLSIQYKSCVSFAPTIDCADALNRELNDRFWIYSPNVRSTKYTAYYSPDLKGSKVRTARFNRPIYKLPPVSYRKLSRSQIEYKDGLAGKGLEIFWVENTAYDIYLLHIQGGGRIKVYDADGSTNTRYLSMTGTNHAPCEFIGKYLIEKGYLPKERATVPDQKAWVDANPEKEAEVFSRCQNYVFFRESDQEPVGRNNISLTVNRSLAIDSTIYETTGIITYVKTNRVTGRGADGKVTKEAYSRFYLAQDTGSKIRGAARCDLYFGYGPLAFLSAYNTEDTGEQYFLVKKSY